MGTDTFVYCLVPHSAYHLAECIENGYKYQVGYLGMGKGTSIWVPIKGTGLDMSAGAISWLWVVWVPSGYLGTGTKMGTQVWLQGHEWVLPGFEHVQ